jgi:hypothetical protein
VYSTFVAALLKGVNGSKDMPHLGQDPGFISLTSGSIGQTYISPESGVWFVGFSGGKDFPEELGSAEVYLPGSDSNLLRQWWLQKK